MNQSTLNLCISARYFNSIPVHISEFAIKTVVRVKTWKRLNRPMKRKTKITEVPYIFRFGSLTILHPKIYKKLCELKTKD